MHGMTPDGKVLHNGKPIVAIDIDGTLADYHGWFLQFASEYLGRKMPDPTDMNPGLPLHEFMGLTKDEYRAVKLAYRQGGMKRSMPAFPGASSLTCDIEKAGAEVWVCTTRPYLRLDNIDPDTREWLSRHNIKYTALLFGESKYEDLAESVGADRVVAVVEDLPEQVERAKAKGLRVYTPARPYNSSVEHRWNDLPGIGRAILDDISHWNMMQKAKPKKEITVKDEKPGKVKFVARPNYGFLAAFPRSSQLIAADNEYEREREARWAQIMDEAFELFILKSRDYGKAGDLLGARGQFADMWRKFGKLKAQIWDNPERAINFEGPEEVLKDLIGHSILFLDYLKAGNR